MSSFRDRKSTKAPLVSIERVVAVLTPIFTAAGGALSTGVGSAIGIPARDFTDLFIAGAAPALGAAITWLLGRQKFVKAEGDTQAIVEHALHNVMADQKAGPAIEDIARLLGAHQDQIISALGSKIGAPASAEDIAKQMLEEIEKRRAAVASAESVVSGLGGASPAPVAQTASGPVQAS